MLSHAAFLFYCCNVIFGVSAYTTVIPLIAVFKDDSLIYIFLYSHNVFCLVWSC